MICAVCGKRKGHRRCMRQGDADICSPCCGETRTDECNGCGYYSAAQRYRADRRTPAAIPAHHFIAEIDPVVEQAVDDALALVEKGKTAEAEAAVDQLIRLHPRNHTVCFAKGTLHAVRGEHRMAIGWFDKATAIFPYFVEAHFNAAVAYQKMLDVGNAIRAFRKVLEMGKPGDHEVEAARSFVDDMARSIRASAGVDLDAFLDSQTEFNRAFALMEQGRWNDALKGFLSAAARNDRNAPTHGNIGLCCAKLGQKAKALSELDRALEIDPEYQPASFNRVSVERMEEGCPMADVPFQRIDYGMESYRRKKPGQPGG